MANAVSLPGPLTLNSHVRGNPSDSLFFLEIRVELTLSLSPRLSSRSPPRALEDYSGSVILGKVYFFTPPVLGRDWIFFSQRRLVSAIFFFFFFL